MGIPHRLLPCRRHCLIVTNKQDSEETDGESSQFEAKQRVSSDHLSQAVATAIVHSFTQNKRHPQLNPMVPTVLINGSVFRIILYDCSKDILLVSEKVTYKEDNQIRTNNEDEQPRILLAPPRRMDSNAAT